jgi:drug/metabolite transporter (DMT)-like permease
VCGERQTVTDPQGSTTGTVNGPPASGIRMALIAAVLFGASAPFAKLLLEGISPQVLAGLLYLGSGAGLGVFWLARRRKSGAAVEAPITRRDLPWLSGAIAAGGVIAPVLLMLGLARTPASAAALLLNLEGVFTASLAWLVFRENVDRRIVLGMAAIVAGGVLLSWGGGVTLTGITGPLFVAAACLGWAVDNNLTQKVSAGDPVQIAGLKGLVAGAVNLAVGLALGGAPPAAPRLAGALAVGFLGYGVSLVLYVLAIRALGTARTGAYFSLAPFVGAVIGLALFGERVTLVLVAAGCLMALGLWLHLTERHLHEHTHERLSHTHRHTHDEHHRHAHGAGDPPGEPHTHAHEHARLVHRHPHYPDIHHRHAH